MKQEKEQPSITRPTINAAEVDAAFQKLGAVCVSSCLLPDELENLRSVSQSFFAENPHTSELIRNGAPPYNLLRDHAFGNKQLVHYIDQLEEALAPMLARMFSNYRFSLATILAKPPGKASSTSIHHDYAVVDERRYASCSIWIPLPETDGVETESLYVLEKSYLGEHVPRGGKLACPFTGMYPSISPLFTAYTPKLGDAVLFDPRTLHYSQPNPLPKPRISLLVSVMPEDALFCWRWNEPFQEQDTQVLLHSFELAPRQVLDHTLGPDLERLFHEATHLYQETWPLAAFAPYSLKDFKEKYAHAIAHAASQGRYMAAAASTTEVAATPPVQHHTKQPSLVQRLQKKWSQWLH